MTRARAAVCVLIAVATVAPARATTARDTPVVIEGVGAAHGFGLAMDGVEGQARAGWDHERILSLFYPGTSTGRAGGTIQVGLARGPNAGFTLPQGGMVSDAPPGAGGSAGFPKSVPPDGRVVVNQKGSGVALAAPSVGRTQAAGPTYSQQEPPGIVPTPPPVPSPTPTPTPKPKPGGGGGEGSPPPGKAPDGSPVFGRIWVWGTGGPGLVFADATGRRYRGSIEVKQVAGALSIVNHVDLENYVAGIAEEKGQAWPLAGLKVLAIAARTLGAATMTWYTKNQHLGYDICPTGMCQVYLGYDGEEPMMRRAQIETAGQIRTNNGRPILAMYHGNGGGQTESYKEALGGVADPHPYLASVKYPFADPSRWRLATTLAQMETALRGAGVAVPGGLERVEVTERGASPRVLRLRLDGSDGSAEVTGTQFATALGLRSTWFDLRRGSRRIAREEAKITSSVIPGSAALHDQSGLAIEPALPEESDDAALRTAAAAMVALAAAATALRHGVPAAARPSVVPRLVSGALARRPRMRRRGSPG